MSSINSPVWDSSSCCCLYIISAGFGEIVLFGLIFTQNGVVASQILRTVTTWSATEPLQPRVSSLWILCLPRAHCLLWTLRFGTGVPELFFPRTQSILKKGRCCVAYGIFLQSSPICQNSLTFLAYWWHYLLFPVLVWYPPLLPRVTPVYSVGDFNRSDGNKFICVFLMPSCPQVHKCFSIEPWQFAWLHGATWLGKSMPFAR